jgi:hypothetical protein
MTFAGTVLKELFTALFIKHMWKLATVPGRRNKLFHSGTLVSVFIIIAGSIPV